MGTSHVVIRQDKPKTPFHAFGQWNTNGDHTLPLPNGYISKIQVNGNVNYVGGPLTQIWIIYAEDGVETNVYGPLNIKTIDVSIGVTLHMKTLLGEDLKVDGNKNGRIIIRTAWTNTVFNADVWGYQQSL